ncbi:hypothetical protein Pint_12466 [Pistacia integerrima]|uniref:Uncharacterized protein n=1 Tax=Pistacia integerrima TaxID=434235 RepID=A0ACC0Y7K6_9ROSI|nr:hypothetical protein Pint_12466 [Pistacia integerrima]
MASPQEKLESINETTPLTDDDSYIEEDYQCYEEAAVKTCSYCGCFEELCFLWHRRNKNGGKGRYLLHQQQQERGIRESWLKKRVRKVKEVSEVLAGPKWKTFIRRSSNSLNGISKKRKSHMQFQYDPQSYKLNFDDGSDGGHIDFLARYAAPVVEISKGELGIEAAC